MKVLTIVGARPQFIKAGPLSQWLRTRHHEVLVHTGQHYDYGMSEVFFVQLGIPEPNYNLGIGGGAHGAQTGAMLAAVEEVMVREAPQIVLVYGDTNSTLAGALAAAKLHIPVAHVEAGLRSFNRRMPEEINRIVADHISTWLFAPSELARDQLMVEGISAGVHVVGDIMADALRLYWARALTDSRALEELQVTAAQYYVATIHRAENTEDRARLTAIFEALGALDLPVVLPLHPRTRGRLDQLDISVGANVRVTEPLGYLDMLRIQGAARSIITDSGGIQKEAYYLSVPCITLRDETEWIETVREGWNVLVGADRARILSAVKAHPRPATHPDLYGDGHTARRIVDILELS